MSCGACGFARFRVGAGLSSATLCDIVGMVQDVFLFGNRYKRSLAYGYDDKNHHHIYLCRIVLMVVLLDLRLYFTSCDSDCRMYDCVFHDKILLYMQRTS